MADKKPLKPDDPEQHKRFIDMAREVEVDEREGAFDRAFEQTIEANPQISRSRGTKTPKNSRT